MRISEIFRNTPFAALGVSEIKTNPDFFGGHPEGIARWRVGLGRENSDPGKGTFRHLEIWSEKSEFKTPPKMSILPFKRAEQDSELPVFFPYPKFTLSTTLPELKMLIQFALISETNHQHCRPRAHCLKSLGSRSESNRTRSTALLLLLFVL